MTKKYSNLETLRSKTSKQVEDFLREYYKQDTLTPYLKQATLDFIKNCRYSKDDVRVVLTKLGYEINGGKDPNYILPAMASIHSILLGFIPLDDIIDGASKQDFKNSDEFAEKLALNYSLSTKLKESGRNILRKHYGTLPSYPKIDALISECLERLDGSHTLEVNDHRKKSLSEYSIDDYIKLVDEATSVLIATSFVIGGLIAKIDEKIEKIMWDYGIELGRLCQIRDDFLDYIDPETTGKLPFTDLSEKRKRFPLLIAYKVGDKKERQRIDEILQKERILDSEVYDVMEIITNQKVESESRKIINEIYERARKNLEQLPKNQPAYTYLKEITDLFAMK
jgi:geranylgeranyl pyrophosphate synthase